MVTHDDLDDRGTERAEPQLHTCLDGERSVDGRPEATGGETSPDRLARQVATMRDMEGWLQASRVPAPDRLADNVVEAIERESAHDVSIDGSTFADGSGTREVWRRLRGLIADGWRGAAWATPATALAIVLLLMLTRQGLPPVEPAGDVPGPAGAAVVDWSFRVDAPEADVVCLVGTFNHWSVCDLPLRRNEDGTWTATVPLPPGRHEYMFVIDGQWESDPQADQVIDDGFGHLNAVLYL